MTTFFENQRIKLTELYTDAISFVRATYENVDQYFTMASPMGQLLQVVLNHGRQILFYIEDSITELNINTATRPDNIKGLVSLTGHNPSRAIGARGTIRLTYNGNKMNIYGNTIIIPNYTNLTYVSNSLKYTIILPAEEARLELSVNNYIDVNVIQGTIEYQQVTGNGDPLQSFNVKAKKGLSIDNYYVNIYVDGKKWKTVESILDMTLNEESCMVKTGQSGGIDIFFGTGYNGMIPDAGSTILIEYLATNGEDGNITDLQSGDGSRWKFNSTGFALNTNEIDLNKCLTPSIVNNIIFGTIDEPIYLSRLIAPHMSRAFVLANKDNYIYFLKKLNMFTIVDAINGFATFDDQFTKDKYNQYKTQVENLTLEYNKLNSTKGADSQQTIDKKAQLDAANVQLNYWNQQVQSQQKDDNTVYLFLVPDVNKRITNNQNYYTCPLSSFSLTTGEKTAIYDLIEESGQRVITVDNAILDLKYPRFVINIVLVIYEDKDFETIRQSIISKTSEYFLKNTRRDRIPVSDIVRIIEDVDGVDSVSIWFDADKNNINIYQNGTYGLDDYGDIILERYVQDAFGNKVPVKDIYPLIRGGFTSYLGTDYEDNIDVNKLSSINISVRGITKTDYNSLANKSVVSSI